MDKLKKFLFQKNAPFILGAALIIIGVLILIFPGTSLKTVCSVLGIIVAVKGALKLFKYIKGKNEETQNMLDLISGVLIIMSALVLILHPQKILSVIPVLIGIAVLIYGISSFFGKATSLFSKISAIITIIIGVGIIGSPFALAEAVTSVIGLAMIVLGILSIIKNTQIKKVQNLLNPSDGYTEVEFTDVDE